MHNQKLLILWNLPTAMKSIIGGSKQNENYDKAKPTSKSKEKSEEKKKRYVFKNKVFSLYILLFIFHINKYIILNNIAKMLTPLFLIIIKIFFCC